MNCRSFALLSSESSTPRKEANLYCNDELAGPFPEASSPLAQSVASRKDLLLVREVDLSGPLCRVVPALGVRTTFSHVDLSGHGSHPPKFSMGLQEIQRSASQSP